MTNLINLIETIMRAASLKHYIYAMFIMTMVAMTGAVVSVGALYTLSHIETTKVSSVEVSPIPALSQACQDDYNAYSKALLKRVYDDTVIVPYIDPVCEKQNEAYNRHLMQAVYR